MDGIIIVNKPEGWTSFDVCNKIRRLSQTKKVGHSGTLDPFATGVLPVFLGSATKQIEKFLNGDKAYIGEMTFGVKTDSGDRTGKILIPNSETNTKFELPNIQTLLEIFKKYTGEIEQRPPMYSAVKVNGQRLYKLARQGVEVERKARKITIYKFELLYYTPSVPRQSSGHLPLAKGENERGSVKFFVSCSKGTYIRQLAEDIGDELGCGAHLSALERVLAQPFHISQSISMDTIINFAKIAKLDSIIIPTGEILAQKT
ncbi:tRNA pseudouridine(55) synthase TruB [Candidatus Saganbacteria bacterium]|nr:tRNA pseudouridine(55) synthase TruB [Candidatus Saganbacteria bacterium]